MYLREITSSLIFCCLVSITWTSSDSVKLSEIKVLTLYQGLMTNGRRSSPVPQLKCVGGTAVCRAFIPKVVQCYNRGSDGTDVQWECKTDMDNAYQFGQISVSCEGYSYAEDPYILKGSCGLEYTLDLTREGHQQRNNDFKKNIKSIYSNPTVDFSSLNQGLQRVFLWVLGIIIFFPLFGLVVYGLYRLCAAPPSEPRSSTDDFRPSYPGGGDRYPTSNARPSPPKPYAPGFRPEFTQGCPIYGGATAPSSEGTTGIGDFWARATTPKVLSYRFADQNIRNRGGTTTKVGDSSSSSPSGTSSGTRTTSGLDGTTRRGNDTPICSSPAGAPSTGTRTASGFGTTTRRGSDSSSSTNPTASSTNPTETVSTATRTATEIGGTTRRASDSGTINSPKVTPSTGTTTTSGFGGTNRRESDSSSFSKPTKTKSSGTRSASGFGHLAELLGVNEFARKMSYS